jgi:hypothetical protein
MTMPTKLSPAQVETYVRDDFLSPIGHFELEPAPAADLDEPARAAYARSYDGYRAAYAEQVALEGR